MTDMLNVYLDESGTRNPDYKPSSNDTSWFGIGGIVIKEEDEPRAEQLVADFRQKWPQLGTVPLHSVDIRSKKGDFRWLRTLSTESYNQFMADAHEMLHALPVFGVCCVIARERYSALFAPTKYLDQWHLCKTAFPIVVERTVKYAQAQGRKLKLIVEECGKNDERRIKDYYSRLKTAGMPFSSTTSIPFNPLPASEFNEHLVSLEFAGKSRVLLQIADLYLYPLCISGKKPDMRTYIGLVEKKKLLQDMVLPPHGLPEGIKYYCFNRSTGETA